MPEYPKSDRDRRAKSQHTRPTISYLVFDLSIFQTQMWSGAVDIAQARDANLITFVGLQFGTGAQANVLHSLIDPSNVDGLVLNTANLVLYNDLTELIALLTRCHPLPATSIAFKVEGVPSSAIRCETGMYDLVSHLIEVHGCRRIAIIRGPEGHPEDDMRYRGYAEALAAHNLPLDPNLVTPHYNWPSDWQEGSREAIEMLLDERKLQPKVDFDAIVGSNDVSAVSAIELLRERGIQVPFDVAVVGFDDDPICQSVTPSVSTVRQPIAEQAQWATEALLTMLAGEPAPEDQLHMPTQMVIRQSCGCLDPIVLQVATDQAQPSQITFDALLAEQREAIIAEMAQAVGTSELGPTFDWARHLLDGFVDAIAAQSSQLFLHELDNVLRQVGAMGGDVEAWQNGLSVLRRRLLPYLEDEVFARADDLWQQMRVMIGQATKRSQAYQILQAEQQAQTLRELSQSLITTFDIAGLMDVLAEGLPRLGIPSCYLSLYEDPNQPVEWSRLMLAYNEEGRLEQEPGGRRFSSRQLVPSGMLPSGRRYSMVVEPLFFHKEQLGFVLFEQGPRDGAIYETLRGQISSALQGALLVQQVKQHAVQLDTAVSETLATVHEMQVTVTGTADQARAVADAAQQSADISQAGQAAVSDAVTGMEAIQQQVKEIEQDILSLSERTGQIGGIIGVVKRIADQSHVLALNANIEAARLGDQGKAFAVVAKEMRDLARQSREATDRIRNILTEIQRATNTAVMVTKEGSQSAQDGMDLASRAGEAIRDLSATIEKAAEAATHIASTTYQQTTGMNRLAEAMQTIKQASTQTTMSTQQVEQSIGSTDH